MNIRIKRGLTASLSAFACIPFSIPAQADPAPVAIEKKENAADTTVAATIDGKAITVAEIDKQIKQKPNYAYIMDQVQNDPTRLTELRRNVLNGIVNRELLIGAAESSKAVDQKDIDKSVAGVIEGYGGEAKLTELLKSIGTDYPTFRAEIAKDFLISNYIEKVLLKDMKISDEELKKAFQAHPEKYVTAEKVRARHILIKVEKNASEAEVKAAESKVAELKKEISKPGGDFAEVAKKNSQCPSAPQGGDLGEFERGMMVPEFEKAAFGAKIGEVSEPVRTDFGFHLIKVESKQEAAKPDFDKARAQIEKDVTEKKREALVQAKLNDLRKEHQVTIKL